MKFKYEQNIFDALNTVLLEADKNGRRMHYREIHREVTNLLGSKISYRKFEQHLKYMVNENLLFKDDPTGKRGPKVYFSLTEKAKRRNTLGILGIDERVHKRRSLYQLLLFFEAIKRRNLLSKRQMNSFLKHIGSSTKNLEKMQETELSNYMQSILYTQMDMGIVVFKPIKDVEIMELVQNDSNKINGGIIDYYTVLPGFTADEFIQYLEMLKKGKDPRPFSSHPAILHVPFVQYMEYTKQEVEDAIASFAEDGLIKPILEIYPGEKRFDISDKSLKRLLHLIWLVKIIGFYLIHYKLIYKDKLTEEEKNYLALYTGKRASDKLIAFVYDSRRTIRNQNNNNWNEEQESMKAFMQKLENDRKSFVQLIAEEYGTMVNKDEVVGDLVQSICFSPFISQNASQN